MEKIYIHYGHKHFDPNLFNEIKNERGWVKPIGGLWASNINAEYGWKEWTKDNEFMLEKYAKRENYFKFKIKEGSKILKITNKEQLKELPLQKECICGYKHCWIALDFELIMKEYDGIEVVLSEDWNGLYFDLYGWDCDSLLVFNKEIIMEVN